MSLHKSNYSMKTNFKIIVVLLAVVFAVVSCGGKGSSIDGALSQMEKAMDKIEKNKTSMTTSDWEALNKELEEPAKVLSEAMESDQVGALKKLKITGVMLRYATIAGEAAFHTVTDSLKTMAEESHLSDSISVVSKQLNEAFENDEMKEALQELQKAAEELKKLGQ